MTSTSADVAARTLGNLVYEAAKSCVSRWEGDFAVEVNVGDYEDYGQFEVCITHKSLNVCHSFYCRVTDKDEVQIDMNEDTWAPLDAGNLFAFMWFDMAIEANSKRKARELARGK